MSEHMIPPATEQGHNQTDHPPFDLFDWERDLTASDVSPNARLVGFIIRKHADAASGMCFLSNESALEQCGWAPTSRNTLKRARDELTAAGLLDVLPGGGRGSSGHGWANTYRLIRTGASDRDREKVHTGTQGVPASTPPPVPASTPNRPSTTNPPVDSSGCYLEVDERQVPSPESFDETETPEIPNGFDRIGTPAQWVNLAKRSGRDRATVAVAMTLRAMDAGLEFTAGPLAYAGGAARCFAGRCDRQHGPPDAPHGNAALDYAKGALADAAAEDRARLSRYRERTLHHDDLEDERARQTAALARFDTFEAPETVAAWEVLNGSPAWGDPEFRRYVDALIEDTSGGLTAPILQGWDTDTRILMQRVAPAAWDLSGTAPHLLEELARSHAPLIH